MCQEEYYEDAFLEEEGIWDSEDDRYVVFSDFHEWFARQPDIRPATVLHDELAIYRLELHLNELRRAFRTTDDYLQTGDALGLMELYGRT